MSTQLELMFDLLQQEVEQLIADLARENSDDLLHSNDAFAIDVQIRSEYSNPIPDDSHFTTTQCDLYINQHLVTVDIDSGAAISVITKPLLDCLGYVATGPSDIIIRVVTGAPEEPIGVISNLPIRTHNMIIPTTAHIIESDNWRLILGNDWLHQLNASIDYGEECLTLHHQSNVIKLPLTFVRKKESKEKEKVDPIVIGSLPNSIESESEELIKSRDQWYLSESDNNSDIKVIIDEEIQPIYTRPYTYSPPEVRDIFMANIKIKQVIAGQPITKGGSRCTFNCDIENHHVHTYCKACKQNLPYGRIVHDCVIGFSPGKIRPVMNPVYLANTPWWKEPEKVVTNNREHYAQHYYKQSVKYSNTCQYGQRTFGKFVNLNQY